MLKQRGILGYSSRQPGLAVLGLQVRGICVALMLTFK